MGARSRAGRPPSALRSDRHRRHLRLARVEAQTRYAKTGDFNIAYQVVGDGPIDLVLSPGAATHLELAWDVPPLARFLDRLASFSRLILFDKRGTGLSDRVSPDALPTLEGRMADVRAVMDAARSERRTSSRRSRPRSAGSSLRASSPRTG